MTTPPDIERLIQEVLVDLGMEANAGQVARGVRRLNHGLPAEDEFSAVCAWLGQTQLLHKLDQHQIPSTSKQDFQVPDLLIAFAQAGPVLVEVKVCNDQTLSFKPDYYRRLTSYAALTNIPLLVAWKYHSIWTLVDISQLCRTHKNFNITFDKAMRENLLGVLVGDVAFKVAEGAGIHFDIAKEKLVETQIGEDGPREIWQARVVDVRFSSGGGDIRLDLHPETIQLLGTWDLQSTEKHFPLTIEKSFTAETGTMEFAHRALVKLLDLESSSKTPANWREVIRKTKITRDISDFRVALNRAFEEGVVSHIFHQQPATRPQFLDKA